ncbi:uncharacterized protein LOC105696003 [Orussus abietinus]|uniref:uncharacterized protein LOC105696003 n=1 Tax=Orussus abietinus TaxID=222816 RepID=UPI000625C65B|nr:uncharacterized protein LOC105696003 [Orussus abietinus]
MSGHSNFYLDAHSIPSFEKFIKVNRSIPDVPLDLCTKCGNRYDLDCPLKSTQVTDHCFNDLPLFGQVFGISSAETREPFCGKKLGYLEVRNLIDKHDLWAYVPSWQVPRVEHRIYSQFSLNCTCEIMPIEKIICMARKNRTLGISIDTLKVTFPRFWKSQGSNPHKYGKRTMACMKTEISMKDSAKHKNRNKNSK